MRKSTRDWLMILSKVGGVMMLTLAAALTAVDPKEVLSPIQQWLVGATVIGNGFITLSSALAMAPGTPDPISTAEVRQMFGKRSRGRDEE